MLTATDNVTSLDISMAFDLEKEPACEHSAHGRISQATTEFHVGPAWGLIRIIHPCQMGTRLLICESGYKHTRTVMCADCGEHGIPRDEVWELVQIL